MVIIEESKTIYVKIVADNLLIITRRKVIQNQLNNIAYNLYVKGNGFRRIERLTEVCHNPVISWVKKAGESLPEQPDYEEIPESAQIDELQTYVNKKSGATPQGAQDARERAPRKKNLAVDRQ